MAHLQSNGKTLHQMPTPNEGASEAAAAGAAAGRIRARVDTVTRQIFFIGRSWAVELW
jgi:hypothetical protein